MRVRRIVDLSVPVGPMTQVYPGDPVPRFEVHCTVAWDGFNLLHIDMGSQTGTHVDAPEHPGEVYPAHHLIATAGGIIGENFTNLGRVDFPDPFVSCLPLALVDADGAPVRAVAMELEA